MKFDQTFLRSLLSRLDSQARRTFGFFCVERIVEPLNLWDPSCAQEARIFLNEFWQVFTNQRNQTSWESHRKAIRKWENLCDIPNRENFEFPCFLANDILHAIASLIQNDQHPTIDRVLNIASCSYDATYYLADRIVSAQRDETRFVTYLPESVVLQTGLVQTELQAQLDTLNRLSSMELNESLIQALHSESREIGQGFFQAADQLVKSEEVAWDSVKTRFPVGSVVSGKILFGLSDHTLDPHWGMSLGVFTKIDKKTYGFFKLEDCGIELVTMASHIGRELTGIVVEHNGQQRWLRLQTTL
ncbi:MAG: DUF416 family protein [Caldilineaceae bacterium]